MSFDKALKFTLSWEGFISNDPDDAGGLTYKGITKNHHPNWVGWKYVEEGNFQEADLHVKDFYHAEYWVKAGCDEIDGERMQIIVFDTAVNMGISASRKLLNECTNYQDYLLLRIARYNEIAKTGANIKWLRGWINRTIALYKTVQKETT